jgi:uncharacterized protein
MSQIHVLRIKPNEDLKLSLIKYAQDSHIQSGSIISAVGSLKSMVVRIADGKSLEEYHEPVELTSLSGTFSDGHIHAHLLAISSRMEVFGGHLMPGCRVNTTLEVVIMDFSDTYNNTRVFDPQTGYDELVVLKK